MGFWRQGKEEKEKKYIFLPQANNNHPKGKSITTQRLCFCMNVGVTQAFL